MKIPRFYIIISEFLCVVNYGSDGSISTILDKIKEFSSIQGDIESFSKSFKELYSSGKNIDDLIKKFPKLDKEIIDTAKAVSDGKKSLSDFDSACNKVSSSTAKFSATLKSVAANIGIMIAVTLAIKAVQYAWDKANTTVEEVKNKINELSDSISTLESEYNSLRDASSGGLTDAEQARLEYLEDRIAREKELLELEEARLIREKYGGGFTDYFDEGNYNAKYRDFREKYFNGMSDIDVIALGVGIDENNKAVTDLGSKVDEYNKISEEIQSYIDQMNRHTSNEQEYIWADELKTDAESKLENLIPILQEEYQNYKEAKYEAEIAIEEMTTDLDNPNLTDKDKAVIEAWIAEYQNVIKVADYYIGLMKGIPAVPLDTETDSYYNWFNKLSDEEKKFAESDEFKNALEEQKNSLDGAALSASNYDAALQKVKDLQSDVDESAISFSDIFSLKDAENNLTDLGRINEEIDKFQSAYKGLKEAMDSYNETGTFTLDQVQEIISYGGDYLKYLMDENGNLQLNEEALNKVAIARINEMRAKALSNLMDNLDKITNEKQALEYLRDQLLDTATAYDALTASRIKAWSENALENGISQGTINKVTKSFENQVSAINEMFDNISVDSIYKSSSSSATKDAEQATKEYIDSYMDYMEQSLETGRIDYQTYSRDVANFLKDMYDQGKIAAKDYHDYTKQMLEVQKDAMDKVISAVTYRIDKEIDAIKAQQDAIQDTIDKLREENDERERTIELEKARYELARLQNQRTVKLYSGTDKGFIYDKDNKAVREAQDNLANLEFEEIIAGLEKEKEALNDSIDELEKYKDKWNDIAKQHEIKINEMYASSILGADWESQILSGRIDTLNSFANSYFAIQQAIADAAWASANEQIKAAQEAAKAADGNTGGSEKVGDVKSIDYSQAGNSFTKKTSTKETTSDLRKRQNTIYRNKMNSSLLKYGTGTENAKPGYHIVSENGDEIILDNNGNALLANGKQLYPFEGGEAVLKASESKEILDNMRNLTPVMDYEDYIGKFATMDFSSIGRNNMNIPDYSNIAPVNKDNSVSVSIGDIHLHEVQNVSDFAKALEKHLPNISVQYNGRH